ncbi:SDR family oxidoreductase [Actinophytocola oryzae]|uniref:3-oxoacyl-[acyl-carrier protein] reductase n=1 Tax=Actinophytocola oryzae TaxID=502181 RepID=A0A4R7VQN7_9PSEU|nr:SDR family oxidoreductase [Actinophytocola oryzae]TDV52066.1 3-oxoacyl-[acyl-carrier protein] reductase [Actinophytocola oryzae]
MTGTALVTGAGRGLGAAIAATLAAHGWSVAVNDLDAESADRVASSCGGVAVPGDVTDEDAVTSIVASASDRLGPVGCLVANATGPQPVVALADLTWRTHLDQLEFFVKSPTLLARAVVPGMTAIGGGRIVNIGSDMPDRALPGWSAYSAAKAAQLALTRTWARELGPANITVNVVAPGWIPVERHADATPAERAAYASEVPLARLGTPQDVAETVAFLASGEAGFITGQYFPVNGGHTIAR